MGELHRFAVRFRRYRFGDWLQRDLGNEIMGAASADPNRPAFAG